MRALLTAIWFLHIALCAGAGYSMLRLWYHRHHPLMGRIGLYMLGFVIEGVGSTVLLFVTQSCHTWEFVLAWVIVTLAADLPRIPLIIFIIRGPGEFPNETANGGLPQESSLDSFRQVVEEVIATALTKYFPPS